MDGRYNAAVNHYLLDWFGWGCRRSTDAGSSQAPAEQLQQLTRKGI
jgi:hypothetical protein